MEDKALKTEFRVGSSVWNVEEEEVVVVELVDEVIACCQLRTTECD